MDDSKSSAATNHKSTQDLECFPAIFFLYFSHFSKDRPKGLRYPTWDLNYECGYRL